MKIRANELDTVFMFNAAVSIMMFFFGAFYDAIADKLLLHHQTSQFPALQVLWCIFWAFAASVNIYYQFFYGE